VCFQLETCILGQKREDFGAEFQFHPNSSKKTDFFIQAEDEALKLSDLSVTSQGRPPNMCAQFSSSPGESRYRNSSKYVCFFSPRLIMQTV